MHPPVDLKMGIRHNKIPLTSNQESTDPEPGGPIFVRIFPTTEKSRTISEQDNTAFKKMGSTHSITKKFRSLGVSKQCTNHR